MRGFLKPLTCARGTRDSRSEYFAKNTFRGERKQAEQDVGSKATRIGDVAGLSDGIAMHLRQSVDKRALVGALAVVKVLTNIYDLDIYLKWILQHELAAFFFIYA